MTISQRGCVNLICASSHPELRAGGQVTSESAATRIPGRWPAVLPPGWQWVKSSPPPAIAQQDARSHRRTGPGQGHMLVARLAT